MKAPVFALLAAAVLCGCSSVESAGEAHVTLTLDGAYASGSAAVTRTAGRVRVEGYLDGGSSALHGADFTFDSYDGSLELVRYLSTRDPGYWIDRRVTLEGASPPRRGDVWVVRGEGIDLQIRFRSVPRVRHSSSRDESYVDDIDIDIDTGGGCGGYDDYDDDEEYDDHDDDEYDDYDDAEYEDEDYAESSGCEGDTWEDPEDEANRDDDEATWEGDDFEGESCTLGRRRPRRVAGRLLRFYAPFALVLIVNRGLKRRARRLSSSGSRRPSR